MLRTIVVASLLLLTGGTADARWRSVRTVDDAAGQLMVLARAEGSHGHLAVLGNCQEGVLHPRHPFHRRCRLRERHGTLGLERWPRG